MWPLFRFLRPSFLSLLLQLYISYAGFGKRVVLEEDSADYQRLEDYSQELTSAIDEDDCVCRICGELATICVRAASRPKTLSCCVYMFDLFFVTSRTVPRC